MLATPWNNIIVVSRQHRAVTSSRGTPRGSAPTQIGGLAMSTLSNQPAVSDNDLAMNILARMMGGDGNYITQDEARKTGLDIKKLEGVYNHRVNPNRDYLAGYRDIIDSDGVDQLVASHQYSPKSGRWAGVLAQFGIDEHLRVVKVFSRQMYSLDAHGSGLYIKVYLTRQGHWVVWHGIHGNSWGLQEHVSVLGTVREMADYVLALVAGSNWRMGYEYTHQYCTNIIIRITLGLSDLLDRLSVERQMRLDSINAARDGARADMEDIRF